MIYKQNSWPIWVSKVSSLWPLYPLILTDKSLLNPNIFFNVLKNRLCVCLFDQFIPVFITCLLQYAVEISQLDVRIKLFVYCMCNLKFVCKAEFFKNNLIQTATPTNQMMQITGQKYILFNNYSSLDKSSLWAFL